MGRRWGVVGVIASLGACAVLLVATKPWRDDAKPRVVQKASFDSLAPPGAPAHWLPPEAWVYDHWLPYDEGRLYALLGVTRGDVWRQLRDDHHTLAELARAHGWPSPSKLAAALITPRRGELPAALVPVLRDRAERTITQGHLAQHLFFHSLHQFTIPSAAPELFGVSDLQFRALRRQELSALTVPQLHGRSPGRVEAIAIGVLTERMQAGVSAGET